MDYEDYLIAEAEAHAQADYAEWERHAVASSVPSAAEQALRVSLDEDVQPFELAGRVIA